MAIGLSESSQRINSIDAAHLTRSAKMFSHFLLFVVILFVAKRLVEIVILIAQRLGRQTSAGSETIANAGCMPKTGEPNVAG